MRQIWWHQRAISGWLRLVGGEREGARERQGERERRTLLQGGGIMVNLMNSCYLIPTGVHSVAHLLFFYPQLWHATLNKTAFRQVRHCTDESFISVCAHVTLTLTQGEDQSVSVNNWWHSKEHVCDENMAERTSRGVEEKWLVANDQSPHTRALRHTHTQTGGWRLIKTLASCKSPGSD